MKAIYEMNFSCGRQGDLDGKFIADTEYVKYLVENKLEVSFGEVLGKHSDVFGRFGEEEIKMISDDPVKIQMFEENNFGSGFNPFDYPISHGSCKPNDGDDESMDFDDWSVEDYIDYKFTNVKPW